MITSASRLKNFPRSEEHTSELQSHHDLVYLHSFPTRRSSDLNGALREMARVLTANGHLLILEFSLPQSSIFRAVYRFYLHQCLPFLGSFITRQKNAYDYLGQSIEEFPKIGRAHV